MTSSLSPGDFSAFFSELWTEDPRSPIGPFPWQQRLVDEVARTGRWPELLDLPTGSGKTAAVDAAVFLLALRDDMPRRIAFVVDRRIVVDQAARRADRMAQLLADPGNRPTVVAVASELRRLVARVEGAPCTPPLRSVELRGGIARDPSWALRPDVPTVVTSTVDQVGSRLLFRGYGVSTSMLPVHAGLLANDCLLLLDEVHLSQPFAQTLEAIERRFRRAGRPLPERWQVARLSATPGEEVDAATAPVFRLGAEDLDPARTPVLTRRLAARKPATLQLVKVKGSDASAHRRQLARACVAATLDLLEHEQIRTLAVVVNRVASAQAVHAELQERWRVDDDPTRSSPEAILLTGRMRPFDRDDLLDRYLDRLRSGRARAAGERPLVLVATQAVEAGADLDVDGLVTECASLDALRQRFGRVDRLGDLTAADTPSSSVILTTSASAAEEEDPVYGGALAATWRWLSTPQELDFGIQSLELPDDASELRPLLSRRPDAPVLFPSHLDLWVQTAPKPSTDPDPSLWLHGLGEVTRDVQVVWRADLDAQLLSADDDRGLRDVGRLVSACPPGSGEALAVPVQAARMWLAGLLTDRAVTTPEGAPVEVSDVDGELAQEAQAGECAPFLAWRGDRSAVFRTTGRLAPGDTVVVPSSYGGLAWGCWDPTNREHVTDLGLRSALEQRRRPALRLAPQLVPEGLPRPPLPEEADAADLDGDEAVAQWLDELSARLSDGPEHRRWRAAVDVLTHRCRVQRLPALRHRTDGPPVIGEIFVVTTTARLASQGASEGATNEIEPETSSFGGVAVPLGRHLEDVALWAAALAEACGLSEELVADLSLAGRVHDLGKVDPRFQALLSWPRSWSRTGAELLAKSATGASDQRGRAEAQARSGYPVGTRHEMASVALLEQGGAGLRAGAHDWDLVLHLVASHHGYARPFVPVALDPAPVELRGAVEGAVVVTRSDHGLERLDSGVPQRFWLLVRRYGWFGLAWLEAIFRLADHRASEAEEAATEVSR